MNAIDIVLEEYKALRTEIAQSIVKQHWIVVGGYALAGTIAAAIMKESKPNLNGLLLIPLVFLSSTSLWLVEANRMVRASYFIAYVQWRRLQELADGNAIDDYDGWEHWIRDSAAPNKYFCWLQDVFQRLAVVAIPGAISAAAVWYVGIEQQWPPHVTTVFRATISVFVLLCLVIRFVSKLSAFRDRSRHTKKA